MARSASSTERAAGPAADAADVADAGGYGPASPDRRARWEWGLLLTLLIALVCGVGPLPNALSGDPPEPDPTGSVSRPGPIGSLDLFLYDQALQHDGRARSPDVVLVAIDDDSLGQVGRWPWSRAVLAALIDRIEASHPAAVAIDILLTEPSAYRVTDLVLAESLQRLARTSALILAVGRTPASADYALPLYPLPAFARDASLAHVLFVTGGDGLVRGLHLDEGELPALALALVDPSARAARPRSSDWLSEGRWPARDGRLLGASDGDFERVSAAALLRGDVDPARLANRLVLLGTTAVGAGDQFATPLLAGRIQASGVELHAAAAAALRSSHLLTPLPPVVHALVAALVVTGLMAIHWVARPLAGLAFTVATLALIAAATFGLAWGAGRWLQPAGMLVATALAYPLWSWRRLTAASAGLFRQAKRLEITGGLFPSPPRRNRIREPISAQLIQVQDAAEQVGRLNRFLMDAIQRLPHPVLVADERHRVMLANEKLALAFRSSPAIGESMLAWLGRVLAQPALQSRTAPHELQGEFRDPVGRHWMVDVSQTGGGQAMPARWLLQLVDITPLRVAEREREQALSFLSHDLRSPQASILAMIDRARLGDDQAMDLTEIERHARHALALTDGFLQFTRADAKPIAWGTVDLEILVTEVADLAWFDASNRTVRISTGGPADAIMTGDADLLRRALANLVENAIRHSPAGSEIRIRHAPDGSDGWQITVEDEGPGIEPALRERIFLPFWQPQAGDAARPGTIGLGLAMVYRAVARHRGTIRVTDRTDGPGARFEIRLPKQPEAIIGPESIA